MFLQDDKDTSQELAAESSDEDAVRLALLTPGLVVGLKLGIVSGGHDGGLPKGVAEIGRASFAHVGLRGLKLACLIDAGIDAGVGDEFLGRRETIDVADLGQNGGAGDRADARDGGDVLGGSGSSGWQ